MNRVSGAAGYPSNNRKVVIPMARKTSRYMLIGMALGAAALFASQFADLRRYMRMRSM